MTNKTRIAIIGAGVSGLAAAVKLAEHGDLELTIYEARQTPGGRTRSFVDRTTGDTLDNGQHLLVSCYRSTLEYLKLIGTDSLVEQSRTMSIEYWEQGLRRHLKLPGIPSPADLVVGLLTTNLLNALEKLAAVRLGNAIRSNRLPPEWRQLTTAHLFEAFAQPSRVVKNLWEPIVLATINADISNASAVLFVSVFRELFFGPERGSSILFPKVGLTDLLIAPALRRLHAARIRLGEKVSAIHQQHDSVIVEAGTEETFDYAICTIPELMTGTQPAYSPIVNAYLWVDRRILASPITGFLGTSLQWAFPKPSEFAPQLLAVTVSAASDLIDQPPDGVLARLWDDLRASVPEARQAKLLHSQIIKEKRATPLFTPDAQASRASSKTGMARVFLAGDYVQNGLPATIEGAIRNGFAAAELVLKARGHN